MNNMGSDNERIHTLHNEVWKKQEQVRVTIPF